MHPRLKEKINLSDSHAILELAAPAEFVGKSPKTLNLRERYRTLILAVRRQRQSESTNAAPEFIAPPDPDDPIRAGDILILLVPSGRVAAIEALR
jgi:Trk K+ transport system NAD-binding subunit